MEVGKIAANERHGEHDADGDDFAQVDVACHRDLFARVEHCCEAGH